MAREEDRAVSTSADPPLMHWVQGGGLDSLVDFLRKRHFPVGPAEAIDAARLVAHLARTDIRTVK